MLLEKGYGYGIVGENFLFNPVAFDNDGDSLSFVMIPYFPNDYYFPAASDSITIDPVTGMFKWEKPVESGNYLFSILIHEWRSGVVIATIQNVFLAVITNSVSSVNEIPETKSLSISPNPTSNIIQISFSTLLNENIIICNLYGEKLKEEKVIHNEIAIDVSELAPGLYIVKCGTQQIGKFLKE